MHISQCKIVKIFKPVPLTFLCIFLEVLVEAIFLSVDPYMTVHKDLIPFGGTMIGVQVAK